MQPIDAPRLQALRDTLIDVIKPAAIVAAS
jgi:hypothetical protein